jgi:hypothetical protein
MFNGQHRATYTLDRARRRYAVAGALNRLSWLQSCCRSTANQMRRPIGRSLCANRRRVGVVRIGYRLCVGRPAGPLLSSSLSLASTPRASDRATAIGESYCCEARPGRARARTPEVKPGRTGRRRPGPAGHQPPPGPAGAQCTGTTGTATRTVTAGCSTCTAQPVLVRSLLSLSLNVSSVSLLAGGKRV